MASTPFAPLLLLLLATLLPHSSWAQNAPAPGAAVANAAVQAAAKGKGKKAAAPVSPFYPMNPLGPAAASLFYKPGPGYTASYYGGQTDGGSCGYGDAQASPFGAYTLSASSVIYRNGAACGACFQVVCTGGARCLPASTPQLTLSNLCRPDDSGDYCKGMKKGLSLAPVSWNLIAVNPNLGVVNAFTKRVPCRRVGGIQFKVLVGNPYFVEVVIQNVAGAGELAQVLVKTSLPGSYWQPMKHDYGAVYSISGTQLTSCSFSFRLTTGYYRETITIVDALPEFFAVGQVYPTTMNFRMAALPLPAKVTPAKLAKSRAKARG